MADHRNVAVEITGANEMADQDVAQEMTCKKVHLCVCEARGWCVYVCVYLTWREAKKYIFMVKSNGFTIIIAPCVGKYA